MDAIYAVCVASHAENKLDAEALLNDLRGPKGQEAAKAAGLKPVAP
jgi:ABC-type molybdate transport system substrate-binding protein